jgi:hypothetical protein
MAEKTQSQAFELIKNEYAEANENFRHFSSLRFAVFSVYFAVQAAVFAVAFGNVGKIDPIAITYAKWGGLLATLVFWAYQERVVILVAHFMKVATALEKKLGYTQISSRPPAQVPIPDINTTTRIFFPVMIIFWIYTIIAK